MSEYVGFQTNAEKAKMAVAEIGFPDAAVRTIACADCDAGEHTAFGIGTVTPEAAWKAMRIIGEPTSCLACFSAHNNDAIHACMRGECPHVGK